MKTKIFKSKELTKTKDSQSEQKFIDIAFQAARLAEEKKGKNIIFLDISKLTFIADYFIIVTADVKTQAYAIANYIEDTLAEQKIKPISIEGMPENNWIILDYGYFIVHVMLEKDREFYKLESFWSNGVFIENEKWQKAS